MRKIIFTILTVLLISFVFSGCDVLLEEPSTNAESTANVEPPEITKNIVILYDGGKIVHFWITDERTTVYSQSDLVTVNPDINMHGTSIVIEDVKLSDIRNKCKEYGLPLPDNYEYASDYSGFVN